MHPPSTPWTPIDTTDLRRAAPIAWIDTPLPALPHREALTPTPGDAPLGTCRTCPVCGEAQERRATTPNAQGRSLAYWSDCRCLVEQATSGEATVRIAAQRLQERDAALLGDKDLSRIEHLTLATFDPQLLRPTPSADTSKPPTHPHATVLRWLEAIRSREHAERGSGPPQALYFYAPTKGCGKTHLAAASYHQARAEGRRVAFIEELSYLSRAWNMPFGEVREQLVALPGTWAWLTVFDDIGRRQPGQHPAATQNAWNDLISRRYDVRRWAIFTSTSPMSDLVTRGTIDEAAYSRLYEMTRGGVVVFDGDDQRLRH